MMDLVGPRQGARSRFQGNRTLRVKIVDLIEDLNCNEIAI
jgi:hypothetical protein